MTNEEYLKSILPELKKPMDYKWRVQSFSKRKPQATCVAYIDARDVMDRLDAVCIYGWERIHAEFKGHLYSGVTIIMPNGEKHTRWDCGIESNTDAEKGEASDSFKRAAVNWGVGRFLYDLGMQYLPANEAKGQSNYPYCVDDSGKQIYDITKHINGLNKSQAKPQPKQKPQLTQAGFDKMRQAISNGEADAVRTSLHLYDISKEFQDELNKLLK